MKRSSIKKASTFKLQASRAKYQLYLNQIDNCAVAQKFPSILDTIKSSSEALFDICFSFREDSPFNRGLNYDNRYFGFHSNENQMVYSQYLGEATQAYLMGDFNGFNPTKHRLTPNEDIGKGWFKLEWDLNEYRLDENSRIQLRVVDQKGGEWVGVPPSCRLTLGEFGIYRKDSVRVQQSVKHRISQLLSYTIDLQQISLQNCLKFIEDEAELLECYNAVILKNLFNQKKSLFHKFSLSVQRADRLQEIVDRLVRLGVKVVLQWNFNPAQMVEPRGVECVFGRESGACEWQIDLKRQEAMAFYLSNIAYYFKQYGIRGLHFTKVHQLCHAENGILFAKIINMLCERLSEDAITLASSKAFIPGLSEHIQEGGLGFSFTYNFHEGLSLGRQHDSIYEVVRQIQASSNCLALNFSSIQPEDYIYLLFSFMIAKRGVFTTGPVGGIRGDLIKILKLRKQQEIFREEATVENINDRCVIVKRGAVTILFNFSREEEEVEGEFGRKRVLYNETEQVVKLEGGRLMMAPLNCMVLESEE